MVAQFVTEIQQMLFVQAPFQKRARIDARRGMSLVINQIARLVAVAAAEEVVEADFADASRARRTSRCGRRYSASYLLARTTIAAAFQRIRLLMRRSSARSPGYGTSSSPEWCSRTA